MSLVLAERDCQWSVPPAGNSDGDGDGDVILGTEYGEKILSEHGTTRRRGWNEGKEKQEING